MHVTAAKTSADSKPRQQQTIKVYPNPAKNYVTFEMDTVAGNTVLSVYDMYGKTVIQKEVSAKGSVTISTQLWNSGLFLWIIRENEIPVGQGKLEIMK